MAAVNIDTDAMRAAGQAFATQAEDFATHIQTLINSIDSYMAANKHEVANKIQQDWDSDKPQLQNLQHWLEQVSEGLNQQGANFDSGFQQLAG